MADVTAVAAGSTGWFYHQGANVGGKVKKFWAPGTYVGSTGPISEECVEFEDGNVLLVREGDMVPMRENEIAFMNQMQALANHMCREALPLGKAIGLDAPAVTGIISRVFARTARTLGAS
jgi:hypothetical protein